MRPVTSDAEIVATLRAITAAPTAPFHEQGVLALIASELRRDGVELRYDEYGQLFARVRRGDGVRPLVLLAHADHPAFELVSADGREGIARVLGGFRGPIDPPAPVLVLSDQRVGAVRAIAERLPESDPLRSQAEHYVRVSGEGTLAAGDWAVLDLPALEVDGDELRMAAADDLAGCAMAVCALREIARGDGPTDVTTVFTRAEEEGLLGAQILVEDRSIPRDAVVVSIEASRALPHAPPGNGIVVRVGDRYNTFANDAEAYLRAAAERLARAGIRTQRALLDGGTCEATAFVAGGWNATAIALPNVNYHDRAPDGRFTCEVVRLSDVRSGIELLVETTRAVGANAQAIWWTEDPTVPDAVRELLRRVPPPAAVTPPGQEDRSPAAGTGTSPGR